VFDILDRWNQLDGRVRYHVAHPGGEADVLRQCIQAESRRRRFFDIGHTAGPVSDPPVEHNPDFPLTLDLRTSPRV
jgi:uncharacterized protein (DUF2126 family)